MYTHLTKWTRPDHYMGASWPEYYIAYGQHRDSDTLTRSNFAALLALLGGESETVLVIRENHWAVGWVEWIGIHETDTAALVAAEGALARLAGYPVLDEDHWSELEHTEACAVWRTCYDWRARARYIREHRRDCEFHDWCDLMGCVRGQYFAGDAGELLR